MKTRIKLLAAAVGMMSVVTSCSNEAVESEVAGSTMLEAEISGIANTRAAIEGTTLPEGSNYGLYVFEDYKAVSGNIKMDYNSTATGYEIAAGHKVKVVAYYPYNEKGVEGEDMMKIYPGTTDYLHTISSEIYTKSNPKASITLHHALARVKFNFKLAEDFNGSCSILFNSLDNVYTQGGMRLGIDGGSVYGYYGTLETLKLENPIKDEIKVGTTLSTEMLLVPQDLNYYKPVVKVEIDSKSKDISADVIKATASANWESGKVYTYNITISEGAKVSISSATIEEWGEAQELESVSATLFDPNGHEYVDLGLPSGTLWATCNVGASSPEEFGDFYAWGETEPKEDYTWKTYKWCKGTEKTLTKYVTREGFSIIDNKTTLDLEDDAAHVNWEGSWRMPTVTEGYELFNSKYCTVSEMTMKTIKGCLITSKINGNSIFLPTSGYRNGEEHYGVGEYGVFLTSSLDSTDDTGYYELRISNKGSGGMWYYSRFGGAPIRPVIK